VYLVGMGHRQHELRVDRLTVLVSSRVGIASTVFLALCLLLCADAAFSQTQDFLGLVRDGTPETVQAAIRNGANVNATDADDWTPLMAAAAYNNRPDVINELLKAGADVNAWDSMSMTSLNWAAMHNSNPKVIEVLLKAGADIEGRDVGGDTPLMFAARYNPNPQVVGALLKAGADLEAGDHTDETALLLAARYNNDVVVTELLDAGAKAGARDNLGMSAYDYARANARLRGTSALDRLKAISK